MTGIWFIEALYLLLMTASLIWVYYDAPKFGINKYLAVMLALFVVYPIGFIIYLLVSRLRKRSIA